MKKAVCVLVKVDSEYLVVNRPNSSMVGLVGGKVDPGENELEAILREVKEEVGLVLEPLLFEKVYTSVVPGEVDYLSTTFTYPDLTESDIKKIKTEPGLSFSLVSKEYLTNPKNTPFASYICDLLSHIKEV